MQSTAALGLSPGDLIGGRYVLGDCIGQGGMGSVFLAEQPDLDRSVAIKVLNHELAEHPAHTRRLRAEARAACRVRSPHCVRIIDCNNLPDGRPYLVMEHVPGRPLGQILADETVSLTRAVELLGQILSALGAAHASGIVHADVKSDNFLVESLAGGDHVTLIDFGLARYAGSPAGFDLERGQPMVSGTPEYMAPEVIAGDPPVPASDLYGAGVILYELLTGAPPFGGATAMEIMLRHAHDAVVPPSLRAPGRNIPPALDRVVLQALAKRPAARFADAATFARALRAAAVGLGAADSGASLRTGRSRPESSTRNVVAPASVARFARGSDCSTPSRVEDLQPLRTAIGAALVRGDLAQIASGYLELARALNAQQRFGAAACELQEGIDLLTAGQATGTPEGVFDDVDHALDDDLDAPHPVDRLVVALAALYEEAGDRQRARRVAVHPDRSPTLSYAVL